VQLAALAALGVLLLVLIFSAPTFLSGNI
jgi:hypothetical protein